MAPFPFSYKKVLFFKVKQEKEFNREKLNELVYIKKTIGTWARIVRGGTVPMSLFCGLFYQYSIAKFVPIAIISVILHFWSWFFETITYT